MTAPQSPPNNPPPPLPPRIRPAATPPVRTTYLRLARRPPQSRRVVPRKPRRPVRLIGCLAVFFIAALFVLITIAYIRLPGRTNILLLGIDYVDPGSSVARTDTIMLSSFLSKKPFVRILSVPRDLWVVIPGQGENRINTAHFFAESTLPDSGPQAVMETIALNFGVEMDYFLRIRFEGFREIIDALGGVTIVLDKPTAGYPAGRHRLTGRKALAFVRNRADSDDFFRMAQGQLMLKALFYNMVNPLKWFRLPAVLKAFFDAVDTNIPFWMWPRLGLLLLFTGPEKIDTYILGREFVVPFLTDQGANVLRPNWNLINLLVQQIFYR